MACDVDERRLLPEGARRGEDGNGRSGIIEAIGQGGDIRNDRVALVRVDDVAAAELQQDLVRDIAVRRLDRGWIGKADGLAVFAEMDVVAAIERKAPGGVVERGRDGVADMACDAGPQAFTEPPGRGAAGAFGEGVETIVEGAVIEGDVHVLREPVDDAVDL